MLLISLLCVGLVFVCLLIFGFGTCLLFDLFTVGCFVFIVAMIWVLGYDLRLDLWVVL